MALYLSLLLERMCHRHIAIDYSEQNYNWCNQAIALKTSQ